MRGRMSQDQFLLKWNNHQNNFVEVFNFLRTQDAFVDVTLACDGKSFSAHKVVLSACSPYFQALFQTNPCKHPIVFLKDVKGQDMEALIEFIYKGEVSVSQTELGSLISTAENLKIKGLAEPERPIEKSVKRHASPPRGQTISTGPGTPLQHAPISLFSQSSPSAKRKRCEPFGSHCSYTNNRDKDEKITINSNTLSGELHRDSTSQVVLLPTQDAGGGLSPADLTPQQSYVSHHPSSLATSEGVLYSVAGTAIYVGTSQASNAVTTTRGELIREVYSTSEAYNNNSEDTVAGPSGVQTPHQNDSSVKISFQNIKLEPSVSIPTEAWEGSNHSYDDGCPASDGGVGTPSGASLPGSNDPLSLALPLHSDISEAPLHDNSRGACVNSSGVTSRCLEIPPYGPVSITTSDPPVSSDSTNSTTLNTVKTEGAGGLTPSGSRRLLECEHCHKQFTSRFNLQRHQLIHTGAKPYECPLCHQRFNQSGHVKTHLRTRHPNHEIQNLSEPNSI